MRCLVPLSTSLFLLSAVACKTQEPASNSGSLPSAIKPSASVAVTKPVPTPAAVPSMTPEASGLTAAFAEAWSGRVSVATALGAAVPRFKHLVIKDQDAFASFIATLPTHKITMKQPAPPSDDPLLSKPTVDFKTKMVLVAIRGDTMYVGPKITAVVAEADKRTVTVVLPPLGDSEFAAAQGGIGTYHAVVVERFDGTVKFSEPK